MVESYKKLIANQLTWSPGCDLALKQLICHTTLPFCSKESERGGGGGRNERGREGGRKRERVKLRERERDRRKSIAYEPSLFILLSGGTNQAPEAKTICSDHCQLLQVIEFCSASVYEFLLRDSHLSMPDCSESAKALMPTTGPNCMPVTLSHTIEDHHRHGKSTSRI